MLSRLSPKATDMRQQALDKIKRLDEEADGEDTRGGARPRAPAFQRCGHPFAR